MNKGRSFLLKALFAAAIYSALLLPFQLNLPLFSGTDIRPSAFVPIVLGIFWGAPAAVGIFIGNLICDLICIDSPLIILGSLCNALSAICARRIFYASWNHGITSGNYIYSSGSLLNFLITVVGVELALCIPISLTVHYYSSVSIVSAFTLIFLNNIHSNIIFGIPAMLFLPIINRWADEPSGKGGKKRNFIALCFALSGIPLALPFIFFDLNPAWSIIMIIPLSGATISASPTPTISKDPTLFGFQSLRYMTFRKLMIIALSISLIISIGIILFFSLNSSETNAIFLMTKIYHLCAYIDVMFLALFAYSYKVVESSLLSPIRKLAAKLSIDGQNYDNEIDVLNKRLDFVVSENSALLTSDEFSIIVGLTSKDGNKKFDIREAKETINDICLKYVGGYISTQEGEGGYKGADTIGSEQILIYTIFGASDDQILKISNDILSSLEQESVIIEKNRLNRYYYYGQDK